MITAEISRLVDEDVHRSACVVCLGVNVDGYNDLAFYSSLA